MPLPASISARGPANLKPAQALFNFDAVSEDAVVDNPARSDGSSVEPAVSISQQAEDIAHDYQLQMQSYALALRSLLPADVRINRLVATLHFIDPNVEVSLPAELLDRETCVREIDDAMQSIAALDGSLDADFFPPFPAAHCRLCNFVELCPAGREWLLQNRERSDRVRHCWERVPSALSASARTN